MKPKVLLVYCIEGGSKQSYFDTIDYPNIQKCPHYFLHYHKNDNVSQSIQFTPRHKVHIRQDLGTSGFNYFIAEAVRHYPPSDFQYILVIQSHCWINKVLSKTGTKYKTILTCHDIVKIIKKHIQPKIEAVIFDCCYMATLETVLCIQNISEYLLACESSAAYRGFLGCAKNLKRYMQLSAKNALRHMVDDCIEYNNDSRNKDRYRTDGSVMYLPNLPIILNDLQYVNFTRRSRIDYDRLHDLYTSSSTHLNLSPIIIYRRNTITTKRKYMNGIAIAYKKTINQTKAS